MPALLQARALSHTLGTVTHPDTKKYNESQASGDRLICELLAQEIERGLPEAENKVWHAHPVWFLDGKGKLERLK